MITQRILSVSQKKTVFTVGKGQDWTVYESLSIFELHRHLLKGFPPCMKNVISGE